MRQFFRFITLNWKNYTRLAVASAMFFGLIYLVFKLAERSVVEWGRPYQECLETEEYDDVTYYSDGNGNMYPMYSTSTRCVAYSEDYYILRDGKLKYVLKRVQ